uniref:Uncharacterized protein n=1 Tax=Daphnia magna TaxID=35525 RepID=A0A0P5CJB5_9CRUS
MEVISRKNKIKNKQTVSCYSWQDAEIINRTQLRDPDRLRGSGAGNIQKLCRSICPWIK